MFIYNYVLSDKSEMYYHFDQIFHKESICFLDIETTGLNKNKSHIYLVGLLSFDPISSHWNITQYFAEGLGEEEKILKYTNESISKFKTLITFNGESFDIPFINHRMSKYSIKSNMDNLSSFDIYKQIKKDSLFLNLENYKLKTIEKSLGIHREDPFSGKECIDLYYKYQKSKKKCILDVILKHNYDDLCYLIDVLNIFDLILEAKRLHIIRNEDKIEVEIENMYSDGDMFNIVCKTSKADNIAYFGSFFNIRWEDRSLFINFEHNMGLITPTKKCAFVDVSSWGLEDKIKDKSDYLTPENIILLKVEDKYELDNIKKIMKELISIA